MNPVVTPTSDLNSKFSRLFRDGKLLQLHISKWSMSVQLTAADLPLKVGELVPEYAKLGRKVLIDEKEMQKFTTIEGSARNYLRAHSHIFPIAQAHFVPNKSLVPVLEKLEEFRQQYAGRVDTFIANYETLKQARLDKFPNEREQLLPCYPRPETIRGSFGFAVGMFEVSFPKKMTQVGLASVQAEAGARERLQTKFEEEYQRQYAHSMTQVDEFLKEAVTSTRGRIVEVFETIARKIQNREIVSATNLKTMRGIIESFDGLDFLDDQQVRARLDEVKAVIAVDHDFKSDQQALDALGNAVGAVLTVARDTTDLASLTGDYIRRIEV